MKKKEKEKNKQMNRKLSLHHEKESVVASCSLFHDLFKVADL